MKYKVKNILKEALGVPDNLYETAELVYEMILPRIKSLKKSDLDEDNQYDIEFEGDFRIADFNFRDIEITFTIIEEEKLEKPEIISMSVESQSKTTDDFRLKNIRNETAKLSIRIVLPENFDYKNLTNFLIEDKKFVIESLVHELKHHYDANKLIYDNIYQRSTYSGVSGKRFGIWPVDRFLHDIYYTTITESLVRPSEVAAAIRNNDISQKDFIKFLQDNDTYKNLRRISNFTYEGLREEIYEKMDRVNMLLEHLNYDINKMSDEEKINEVLRLVMVNVANWTVDSFRGLMTTSFIEKLFGFGDEKEKVFQRFANRNNRFKTPEEFFRYYEKLFKFVGENMIRKIAKLFAITKKS